MFCSILKDFDIVLPVSSPKWYSETLQLMPVIFPRGSKINEFYKILPHQIAVRFRDVSL